jgi:hypothetical protein
MSLHTQKHKTKNNMGASRGAEGNVRVRVAVQQRYACVHSYGPVCKTAVVRAGAGTRSPKGSVCVHGLAPVFEKLGGFCCFLCCFLLFLCDFSEAATKIHPDARHHMVNQRCTIINMQGRGLNYYRSRRVNASLPHGHVMLYGGCKQPAR